MSIGFLVTIFAVFGAVALGVGGLMQFVMTQTNFERRRLKEARLAGAATGVLLGNRSLDPEQSKIFKQLSGIVPRSPKEMGKLRRKFVRAGYHNDTPIAIYSLGQLVLPAIFAFVPLVFLPMSQAWMVMIISALLGYLIPGFILSRITSKRQKIITNGLPDLLDLLIVCLEAGSSLDQAIVKATDELELAYPPLAEEFRMLITETRAGKPRLEAFKNLAARTGVDDVRALVSMLVQTDRFGTSVSQALRTHAEVSRTKRRQRAEERAAKIGVKLVFPLVFLLFPAFFTVTLGPAVVRFVRVLFGEVGVG
jgi:tight adherence protein C